MGIEGRHILSTRAAESNDEFESVLISYGAVVECFPTIRISPAGNKDKLDEKLNNINNYDGIFFTSANGVKYFLERAGERNILLQNKIFCVGEKTGVMVKKYGYTPSSVPGNFSSDSLIKELNVEEIQNKKFLLPKGNLGLDNLKIYLEKYSTVEEVIVYETNCPLYSNPYIEWIKDILVSNGLDCIAFFSPSAIDNFYSILGGIKLKDLDVAVIGKTTLNKAFDYNLQVNVIPDISTSENLAKAIVDFYERKN